MENRGLGGIAFLLIIGIAVVFFGVLGGPGSFFGDNGDSDIPSPSGSFYVYDSANVLTDATKDYIVSKNWSLCEQCGAQVVVACIKTTGNMPISEYASMLFENWQIGDSKTNNGVLILLAVEDNDYYMLQGNGIKSSLPSGEIKVILTNNMEPSFATGDYDTAVKETFDRVIAHFEAAYGIDVVEATREWVSTPSDTGNGGSGTGISVSRKDITDFGVFVVKSVMVMLKIVIAGMVIIVVATVLLIVFLMKRKKKKGESFSIDEMVEPKAPPKENVNPYSKKQ